ncbi:hypothetical protein AX14_000111 [Amanita brunnescens Koide BX004]|nr:hypothetical protein AX14_000111 [Amanita brunnescens Koide BX004]
MANTWDGSDDELESMCSSSDSSFDDEQVNFRVRPYWPSYIYLFKLHGIQLDTVRHVREYYNSIGLPADLQGPNLNHLYACGDDDALCPDYGLPDYLFRGTRVSDGKKLVIKAAHLCSREYNVIRALSSAPLRDDPMNHTIPVLDLIVAANDSLIFIVMEQWSSQLMLNDASCCPISLLSVMRQCIEHVAFMHKHHFVHLDISAHNILTDYNGHCAFIDFERSRRFISTDQPILRNYRGTEVPPEYERQGYYDPYKVDIWALGILISRACKSTGYDSPEMRQFLRPILQEIPERRPTASSILDSFTNMLGHVSQRYGPQTPCTCIS